MCILHLRVYTHKGNMENGGGGWYETVRRIERVFFLFSDANVRTKFTNAHMCIVHLTVCMDIY